MSLAISSTVLKDGTKSIMYLKKIYLAHCINLIHIAMNLVVPVAQWVKHWPTDLAVLSLSPSQGEIFSTVNGVTLHTAFHYHSSIALI